MRIHYSLAHILTLCECLGNPQDRLCFLHIAGTNGKGSTAAFCASILKEAGYRTGVFSSPAVFRPWEIIRIGGRSITKADYDAYLRRVEEACARLSPDGDGEPSLFEKQTALSFLYFAERDCEIVVLEAGMGGLYDATNIVKNTPVCVFTPISIDHTAYLGNTLAEIARSKAGILKAHAAVVSAHQEIEVLAVLRDQAADLGLSFCSIDEAELRVKKNRSLTEQSFSIGLHNLKDLKISLLGEHQAENAALAVCAVKALPQEQFFVSDAAIRKGLHNTKWPGRFEVVHKNPVVILDGAHNGGGAEVLRRAIERYLAGRRLFGIVGMYADKDHDAVLSHLAPCFAQLFTVSTRGERAYRAEALAANAAKVHPCVSAIGGIEEAIELAFLSADRADAIVIFGSLSLLAPAKRAVRNLELQFSAEPRTCCGAAART